jgi:hypothetical protein
MNEFRIFFQLFLIIVFFSGIYVIFWLDKYHETFDDSIDPSLTTTLNNSTDQQTSSGIFTNPIIDTITTTLAPYLPINLTYTNNPDYETTDIPYDETTDIPYDETTEIPYDETTEIPYDETTEIPYDETTEIPYY